MIRLLVYCLDHAPELVVLGAIFIGILMLAGCATDQPVEGARTAPPAGWMDYCMRHPAEKECR